MSDCGTAHGTRLAPVESPGLPDAVFRIVEAGPLWQRASGRDEQGRALGDCLLLLPRRSRIAEHRVRQELQLALRPFNDRIRLVEWNLSLGLLYISLPAQRGICAEVAEAVRRRLPQARVVGGLLPPARTSRWRIWLSVLRLGDIRRRLSRTRLPGARRPGLSPPDSDAR